MQHSHQPPPTPGVGLSTKVGTAHFIRTLAQRGALTAPATPAVETDGGGTPPTAPGATVARSAVPQLLKALRSAVACEHSSAVRKAYAAAAAAIATHSTKKLLSKFVTDSVGSYGAAAGQGDEADSGGSDEGQRLAGALLLRELMRASPDAFSRHASEVRWLCMYACRACMCAYGFGSQGSICETLPTVLSHNHTHTQILPTAFLGKMDESSEVAAAWRAVWDEGAPSEAAAVSDERWWLQQRNGPNGMCLHWWSNVARCGPQPRALSLHLKPTQNHQQTIKHSCACTPRSLLLW